MHTQSLAFVIVFHGIVTIILIAVICVEFVVAVT